MYLIVKASVNDIEALVKIQVAAFAGDRKICGVGPPGFDSPEHQVKAMARYSYCAVKHLDIVVGGFYFAFDATGIELHRLFVDPNYQSRGVGKTVLDFLVNKISQGMNIELETPTFSIEAQRFYEKNGFKKIKMISYGSASSYLYRISV